MNTKTHTKCGGVILSSKSNGYDYIYCDKCFAFTYCVDEEQFPNGKNKQANWLAFKAGDDTSPEIAIS